MAPLSFNLAISQSVQMIPLAAIGKFAKKAFGSFLRSTFGVIELASQPNTLREDPLSRSCKGGLLDEILPPEKTQFSFEYDAGGPPVLSPDGGAVAFPATDASGKNMLWIRSFDSLTAHSLPGTEGGSGLFWSANGRKLGFFADGKLKTLELSGGPARVVADAPAYGGGSWNREGTLLFVPDYTKGLYQVAASGGDPVPFSNSTPPNTRIM